MENKISKWGKNDTIFDLVLCLCTLSWCFWVGLSGNSISIFIYLNHCTIIMVLPTELRLTWSWHCFLQSIISRASAIVRNQQKIAYIWCCNHVQRASMYLLWFLRYGHWIICNFIVQVCSLCHRGFISKCAWRPISRHFNVTCLVHYKMRNAKAKQKKMTSSLLPFVHIHICTQCTFATASTIV